MRENNEEIKELKERPFSFREKLENKGSISGVDENEFLNKSEGVSLGLDVQQGEINKEALSQREKEELEEKERLENEARKIAKEKLDLKLKAVQEEHDNTVNEAKQLYEKNKASLDSLKPGEVFKDAATGATIPRNDYKKWGIINKKEKEEDYKKRVESIIKQDQFVRKAEAFGDLRSEQIRKELYDDDNNLQKVELTQVYDNESESNSRLKKQHLLEMVEADMNKLEKDSPLAEKMDAFFAEVKKYNAITGEYKRYRQLKIVESEKEINGKKVKVREGITYGADVDTYKNREINAFIKMREKLDELREMAKDADPDTKDMVAGYEAMLKSMSGGTLQIPKDVEIIREKTDESVYYEGEKVEVNDRSKEPLFAHEPNVNDVVQGSVGDCYLVTALGAVASANPDFIKGMMKDNGNTVTVRLYKPSINMDYRPNDKESKKYKSEAVYIEVPKRDLGRHGGKNALWINIIERAYNIYRTHINARMDAFDKVAHDPEVEGEYRTDIQVLMRDKRQSIYKRAMEMFPEATPGDLESVCDTMIIQSVEGFIKSNKALKKSYNKHLGSELDSLNKGKLDAKTIKGGHSTEFLSIMTGTVHASHSAMGFADYEGALEDERLRTGEHEIDRLNALELIFDNVDKVSLNSSGYKTSKKEPLQVFSLRKEYEAVKKNPPHEKLKKEGKAKYDAAADAEEKKKINDQYGPMIKKAKNEWDKSMRTLNTKLNNSEAVFKLSKMLIKNYLKEYVADNKAKNAVEYKQMMTREQLTALSQKALKDYKGMATVKKLADINGFDTNSLFKGIKLSDEEKMNAIEEVFGQMLEAFVENAQETTILNYKSFSGKYSAHAEEVFDTINEALQRHCAVTASTFKLSSDMAYFAEQGETVFDGMAGGHAYMVLGTRVEEEDGKLIAYVTVKNPWSAVYAAYEKDPVTGEKHLVQREDDATKGISELELNDFMRRVRDVNYAEL